MKDRRSFNPEFKRRVVEESLSGLSTPAQVVRKHGISWGLLSHWKKRYGLGKLGNPPRYELAYKERIKELECMVGRLTMDNDFLKNAISATIEQTRKRESLLPAFHPARLRQKAVPNAEDSPQHLLLPAGKQGEDKD